MTRRAADKKNDPIELWKVVTPEAPTVVASWLAKVPGAHPFWDHWWISTVHLRETDGMPAPQKTSPEMGYELLMITVNPEKHPEPDPDAPPFETLRPIDIAVQFGGVDDVGAARVTELVMEQILQGRMSPDQDFRSAWAKVIPLLVKQVQGGK